MNSIQVSNLMNQDDFIRQRFKGIYPIDLTPKNFGHTSIILINLDRSYEEGSHWIVIHHADTDKADHFDPLENKPDVMLHYL